MKRLLTLAIVALLAVPAVAQNWPQGRLDYLSLRIVRDAQIYGRDVTIDAAAPDSTFFGASAWAGATGASQTGGDIIVAGGLGSRLFTVLGFAGFANPETVTIDVNGAGAVVLTEAGAPGFVCAAAGSNAACAANLTASINANVPGVYAYTVGDSVYLRKDDDTYSIDLTTDDAGSLSVTEGADGVVNVLGLASLGPLLIPDGVVGAPGLAFANETTTGLYRNAATDARFAVAGGDVFGMDTNGATVYPGGLYLGTTVAEGLISTPFSVKTAAQENNLTIFADQIVDGADTIMRVGDHETGAPGWAEQYFMEVFGSGLTVLGDDVVDVLPLDLFNKSHPIDTINTFTSNMTFSLYGTDDNGATFDKLSMAHIQTYQAGDWWDNSGTHAACDSGIRFYTTSNGADVLALTMNEYGQSTFANTANGTNFSAGAGNYFLWAGRSAMSSGADGQIRLTNNGVNNFDTLYLGPAAPADVGVMTIESTNSGATGFTIQSDTAASGGADTGITLAVAGNLTGPDNALNVTDNAGSGRLFTLDGGGIPIFSVTGGITACNPGGQGDCPLTTCYNIITVCANVNDAVTMPSARAGYMVFVVNEGANPLELWPASGDDLGAGVNVAISIAAAGGYQLFLAANDTMWYSY